MAHVTMIHGIGRKPEAGALLAIWRRTLARAPDGLDLGAEGVTSSMVYWADVLYAAPDPDIGAYESASEYEALARDVEDMGSGITLGQATDADWVARLGGKMLLQDAAAGPDEPAPAGETALERFPLPWAVKQRFLAAFLRDVHHYLFNVDSEPRPGERYKVRDEIRRRFVDALGKAPADRPHVVVSHSLGTVIAYDCLKNVADCPPIDALVTIGSPLGIDEVQDKLTPFWTREDGFPSEKTRGPWVNVFDRLDVVAALDPELGSDFRKAGQVTITDIEEPNYGTWRHAIRKYFEGQHLRAELRHLLAL